MRNVFIDVDTQIDFMYPAGALYVPGAERLVSEIARLNSWAMAHDIPLISTVDAHTENDPEFLRWPAHCVAGTVGQQKPAATFVGQRILPKQHNDPFTNPQFAAMLDELAAERYVVYGVVTEICVRCALFGLLQRGRAEVALVTDGVRSLDEQAAASMLRDFTAAGGVLTETAQVLR